MSLNEVVNRVLFVSTLATFSVGAVGVAENAAYAARSETIQEHYKRSRPADYLMLGARVTNSEEGDRVYGQSDLFEGNEWVRLYLHDPQYSTGLQAIFKELHGRRIFDSATRTSFVFDFNRFHDLMIHSENNFAGTSLFNSGYLSFTLKPDTLSVTVPLPQDAIHKIFNL